MSATLFQTYIQSIQKSLAAGDATEHTHRPALKTLLEAVGQDVMATNEPKHVACGAPDFIVTRKGTPLGYVECKDVGHNLGRAERSEQLARYRASLSNLILTDYLEFRWYVGGEHQATANLGKATPEGKIKRSRAGVQEVADLLAGFYAQEVPTIGTPQELARRMAAQARLIRGLIEQAFKQEEETGALHGQLDAFRETLIPDLTPEQFADMYAQTIAYGLFAARVRLPTGQGFTRQQAAWNLPPTNPFLRKLFNEIAGPDLDTRVAWAVDDLAYLLSRADMAEVLKDFGRATRQEDPMVHFYETFLGAYDPQMRKGRGVYYTPEPVVSYIVRSIDHLIKTRFNRPWGLAEPDVLILDPAVGTATFLYFVIQQIHETITRLAGKGAWNSYVTERLLPRVFGFELLMAPYTVAHMKLGILLQRTDYDFAGGQRLGIYLTNALEEAVKQAETLGFAGFISEEANAAAGIKKDKPIMVVLGNPPYAGHSANRSWEIKDGRKVRNFIGKLVHDYYYVDGKPLGERSPKWLQDDYVKFIRWGQWRIERTGAGILAFITNHGYLDNPTFRGMRQQLMQAFTDIYVLDLHGSTKKQESAPDGSKDENVFDIQPGVAIGIFIKEPGKTGTATVHHAELWGPREGKYRQLIETDVETAAEWTQLEPQPPFYLFVPQDIRLLAEYEQGWPITEVMPVNVLGFQTHRDHFAIAFDREEIVRRMEDLRNPRVSDEELRQKYRLRDSGNWQLPKARERVQKDRVWEIPIIKCVYRPFDWRFCYFSDGIVDRPRRELLAHVAGRSNLCLNAVRQTKMAVWQHAIVSDAPAPAVFVEIKDGSNVFPLYLYSTYEERQGQLLDTSPWPPGKDGRVPNLNPKFVADLEKRLGLNFISDGRGDLQTAFGPEDIFHYAYAVFHSPIYRERYAEFLKIDFPRLPLTSDRELFKALAEEGEELVALHLMESPLLHETITRYPEKGSDEVGRVRYVEPTDERPGLVYINKTQYFEGVEPEVWEFQIGGYQVLHKWLKDRKGRQLLFDDLLHYQKIVVVLKETMRLMEEIDEVVPEWPIS